MTNVWQLLLTGFTCLVLLFFAIADLRIAYAIASAILFLGFAAGFLFQPKGEFVSMTLPGLEGGFSPVLNGTDIGEAFPQIIFLRIELVNLAFLGFVAFIPIAILIWIISGNDVSPGSGFPPANVVIVPMYLFWLPFSFIGTWIRERYLLHNAEIFWAFFQVSGSNYSYQFFDPLGDRWGGLGNLRFRVPPERDTIALAVARAQNLDESKLSFSFMFHRFVVIDRIHAPDHDDKDSTVEDSAPVS
ncbi:MAG: hypothetical protein JWO13_2028 [Acidobacteriales bacterium]|nr:hypothetical protein [Terriglobales bacterium]